MGCVARVLGTNLLGAQAAENGCSSVMGSLQAAATVYVCRRCKKGPQNKQNAAVQRYMVSILCYSGKCGKV